MRYEQRWTKWLVGIALTGAMAVACGSDGGSSRNADAASGGTDSAAGSSGDGGASTGGKSGGTGGKSGGTGGKGTGGIGSGGANTGGSDLGGATGTGGESPVPTPYGSALVNAGGKVKSTNYQMVFTLGQSSSVQTNVSSPSYSLRGGLTGATETK